MIDISKQFNFLSGAWHLAYYTPGYWPSGSLSSLILNFKDNKKDSVDKWSRWAKDELAKNNFSFNFIIRALRSTETQVSGLQGLDALGGYLAQNLNAIYCPEVLKKIRITTSMHTLNKAKREESIHGAYIVADRKYNFRNKNILIIDDVCTSGTTVKEMVRSLKEVWPSGRYYFFCLGKTKRSWTANDNIEQNYF